MPDVSHRYSSLTERNIGRYCEKKKSMLRFNYGSQVNEI